MIKVNGVEIIQNRFPDGSLQCSALNIDQPIVIDWYYENDSELFTLQCLRNHYNNQPATLQMLYCPHARMDRINFKMVSVFTLQAFAKIINSMNFNRVLILDAHSYVAPALLDRCTNLSATSYILTAINNLAEEKGKNNLALFFPDEGAMKRYTDYFFHIPFSFGIKKRDWETGKILSLNIQDAENVKDKDVLIIDDICSKGTTFYYSAKALLEAGAKSVSLYVTHCENTILEGKIFESGLIERVYTTDSLVHKEELKEKVIYV